ERVRNPKTRPVGCSLLHRLNDSRMRVPQNRRAPGADVIHILVSVDVLDVSSFSFGDKERLAANRTKCPNRRVDATRNVLQRFGKKLFGLAPRNHEKKLAGAAMNARAKVVRWQASPFFSMLAVGLPLPSEGRGQG